MNESHAPDSERTPPRERFAPISLHINLREEAAKLNAEADGEHSGHRQIALYKYHKSTVALFRFAAGGFLPPHRAPGAVFIQVLEGRMSFDLEGTPNIVAAGEMLVLAPGTPHDAKAIEPSLMLLTVCLDKDGIDGIG